MTNEFRTPMRCVCRMLEMCAYYNGLIKNNQFDGISLIRNYLLIADWLTFFFEWLPVPAQPKQYGLIFGKLLIILYGKNVDGRLRTNSNKATAKLNWFRFILFSFSSGQCQSVCSNCRSIQGHFSTENSDEFYYHKHICIHKCEQTALQNAVYLLFRFDAATIEFYCAINLVNVRAFCLLLRYTMAVLRKKKNQQTKKSKVSALGAALNGMRLVCERVQAKKAK